MGASFAAHPNIMPDLLFRRWTQIEIDPRIRSSRLHRDGCSHCAADKTHFINASWYRGGVMAIDIGASDNRRHLSGFLLEPDFSAFHTPIIRAGDISLDGGGS